MEPETLPQRLLNAIGDYGQECANVHAKSDLERIHLWEVLISEIKLYAKGQMARLENAPVEEQNLKGLAEFLASTAKFQE